MSRNNEFKHVEGLLSGKIKQTSPGFEEALRKIPGQPEQSKNVTTWQGFLKIAGIAAAITLLTWSGIEWNVTRKVQSMDSILEQDEDLLTLFSLSSELELAAPLLSEENLAALDYLTSSP